MAGVFNRLSVPAVRGQAVIDMRTEDLLGILLGREPGLSASIGRAATRIDAGDWTMSSAQPEELTGLIGTDADEGLVLAAAFEVARRAAAPPVPAVLRGAADVAAIGQRELGGRRRERLLTIICDAANRPLRIVTVADGALDRCRFPVREILNAVLRFDGRAFALAHNHPSGLAAPSEEDIAATRAVTDGAGAVGVRFLGHVVIGSRGWSELRPDPVGSR